MKDEKLILNCVWDFQVAPAYYDFIVFLQLADQFRIRKNLKFLRLIFMPGPRQGYRDDNLRSTESNELMTRNVLLPACHLVESCQEVLFLKDRSIGEQLLSNKVNVFPVNYSTDNPISNYGEGALLSNFFLGSKISYFKSPKDKLTQVDQYLLKYSKNKKPLVITLREASHDQGTRRCLIEKEWIGFFEKINLSEYQPIIVRDTEKVFNVDTVFHDFPHCHIASIDLLFRSALYERAFINFFCNNGPSFLALFLRANAILFKPIDESVTACTSKWYENIIGIIQGEQRIWTSRKDLLCWEDDNVENIDMNFNIMIARINENKNLFDQNNFGSIEQVLRSIKVVLKYVFNNINFKVSEDDLLLLNKVSELLDIVSVENKIKYSLRDIIKEHEGGVLQSGALNKILKYSSDVNIAVTF